VRAYVDKLARKAPVLRCAFCLLGPLRAAVVRAWFLNVRPPPPLPAPAPPHPAPSPAPPNPLPAG
jgi:hypothetical protein